jgi:hypothetical protein
MTPTRIGSAAHGLRMIAGAASVPAASAVVAPMVWSAARRVILVLSMLLFIVASHRFSLIIRARQR